MPSMYKIHLTDMDRHFKGLPILNVQPLYAFGSSASVILFKLGFPRTSHFGFWDFRIMKKTCNIKLPIVLGKESTKVLLLWTHYGRVESIK